MLSPDLFSHGSRSDFIKLPNSRGTKETRNRRERQTGSEILNRDDPVNPVEEDDIEEPEEIGEIDLGSWRLQEVKNALKGTKPRKVLE